MRFWPFSTLRDEDGNALIELSLILPIFLIMLVAVVDYGLVFEQYIVFNDSVRAAAEYATVYGHDNDTSTMQTLAAQFASGVPNYHVTAASFCSCSHGGTAVSCTSTCSNVVDVPYQYVQVTATASLPLVFHVQGLPLSIPVSATTSVPTSFRAGQ